MHRGIPILTLALGALLLPRAAEGQFGKLKDMAKKKAAQVAGVEEAGDEPKLDSAGVARLIAGLRAAQEKYALVLANHPDAAGYERQLRAYERCHDRQAELTARQARLEHRSAYLALQMGAGQDSRVEYQAVIDSMQTAIAARGRASVCEMPDLPQEAMTDAADSANVVAVKASGFGGRGYMLALERAMEIIRQRTFALEERKPPTFGGAEGDAVWARRAEISGLISGTSGAPRSEALMQAELRYNAAFDDYAAKHRAWKACRDAADARYGGTIQSSSERISRNTPKMTAEQSERLAAEAEKLDQAQLERWQKKAEAAEKRGDRRTQMIYADSIMKAMSGVSAAAAPAMQGPRPDMKDVQMMAGAQKDLTAAQLKCGPEPDGPVLPAHVHPRSLETSRE